MGIASNMLKPGGMLIPLISIIVTAANPLGRAALAQRAMEHPPAEAPAALPEFEVASVKPVSPDDIIINAFLTYPGGRVVGRGCTLRFLVMEAFDMQDYQISGGPDWITHDRFEIEAKPPASSASAKSNPPLAKLPPNQEERQMLQALLIERFQLKFHRDTREAEVYVLSANVKKLKLQPPKDKNEYPWAGSVAGGLPGGDGLRGTNISMPELATRISDWLKRPVLDRTGLQGSFDFEFTTGEDDAPSEVDLESSIVTSLKGIGLQLKTSKGPVEALVIDHVEKPGPN
jgi:uncharacterized protein (TIGR03435 family)